MWFQLKNVSDLWRRGVRQMKSLFADIDLRIPGAIGQILAVEASQVGLFDETRMRIYAAGMFLSACAGLTYKMGLEKYTFSSCLVEFFRSGLFGLGMMLLGMSFEWGASQPGILLGLAIFLGLCGPAVTEKFQSTLPEIIAWILQSAAERLVGKNREIQNKGGQ